MYMDSRQYNNRLLWCRCYAVNDSAWVEVSLSWSFRVRVGAPCYIITLNFTYSKPLLTYIVPLLSQSNPSQLLLLFYTTTNLLTLPCLHICLWHHLFNYIHIVFSHNSSHLLSSWQRSLGWNVLPLSNLSTVVYCSTEICYTCIHVCIYVCTL